MRDAGTRGTLVEDTVVVVGAFEAMLVRGAEVEVPLREDSTLTVVFVFCSGTRF